MTYRLLIAYDGTGFAGWQRQQSATTVQQALESALEVALRTSVSVVGAGRTDSGVHARGQVAHFRWDAALDTKRLLRSLNGLTGAAIVVRALEKAPDGFHARYDATARRYHYYVSTEPMALGRQYVYALPWPVDFDRMNAAAAALAGSLDASAFCRSKSLTGNALCEVRQAQWVRSAAAGAWHFEIESDRFLHGMVRAIVGTLLDIGRGKRCATDLAHIIASGDRQQAGPAAPARGLVLEAVRYADAAFKAAREHPHRRGVTPAHP